jgi:hypothetical protein
VLSQSKQTPNADTRVVLDGHLFGVDEREGLAGPCGLSVNGHRWSLNRRTRYHLTNRPSLSQRRGKSLRRIGKAILYGAGLGSGLRNKSR